MLFESNAWPGRENSGKFNSYFLLYPATDDRCMLLTTVPTMAIQLLAGSQTPKVGPPTFEGGLSIRPVATKITNQTVQNLCAITFLEP